ncbi:MAG: hypothetical protein ABI947_24600 [Chloroflexota bacterium]
MSQQKRPSEAIQKRALTAMLTDAFFTWPSAILIGFSIIAFFLFPPLMFPWWHPEFWLIFGVVAEAIYMAATVTDPVANQEAVSRMLTERFDPRGIKNISARQRMQKALEYKRSIDDFVSRQIGARKVSLGQTADEINSWIERIYQLAKAIDTFDDNQIIDRDRRAVPTELENLKRRMAVETDPGVKSELQDAINIRQQLLNNLQSITNAVKRTDIKLDNTLAQLSTVYAQMQLLDSKEIDGGRSQRLRAEIQDEIASLSDTISAMDDVYSYQGYNKAVANLGSDAAQSAAAGDDSQSAQRNARGGGNG